MAFIDNPPAPPNVAQYPITALNIYPKGASSGTFDVTKQRKDWKRDLQPGENPAAFIVFSYYDSSGVFHPNELGMTLGDAAAVNMAPTGTVEAPGASDPYWTQPVMPSPARPLLPGESVVANPFGANVVNANFVAPAAPQSAQQSTESDNISRALAGINALLTAAKLPTV